MLLVIEILAKQHRGHFYVFRLMYKFHGLAYAVYDVARLQHSTDRPSRIHGYRLSATELPVASARVWNEL